MCVYKHMYCMCNVYNACACMHFHETNIKYFLK